MVEWPQNHWKTIESNGQLPKKYLMVMVKGEQNHWKTIESNGQLPKKVVNGDGQRGAKPSKNHWSQWFSQEKTIVSHRSQKMTIVHLYHCLFVSKTCWLRKWSEAGSHREIIHFELLTPLFWPELYAPKESPPTFLCLAAPIGRQGEAAQCQGTFVSSLFPLQTKVGEVARFSSRGKF